MTVQDFSDTFDTLLNGYATQAGSKQAPLMLDEYEKSVFLTRAQEEEVVSLYNGRNSLGEGYEETEEVRRYLSALAGQAELAPVEVPDGMSGVGDGSAFFELPRELWFITYEALEVSDAKCDGLSTLEVIPVTHDEYHRVRRNPFRGSSDRRALRLDLSDGIVEVVCDHSAVKYHVRYLRKPRPIILVDLPDGMDIGGEVKPMDDDSPCELHEALQKRILERAVMLALRSRGYGKGSD